MSAKTMRLWLDEVYNHVDTADPSDIVPILVIAGECTMDNRFREEMYLAISENGLTLPNLLVVCFDERDMPWPIPLNPVVYYFLPGGRKPLFYTLRGTKGSYVIRDVNKARRMKDEDLTFEEATYTPDERQHIVDTEAQLAAEAPLPSVFQMVRSLGHSAFQSAKAAGSGLPVLAAAQQVQDRYTTCQGCEHFTAETRCTQCGCFMQAKVNLATAACPVGKW